MKSQPALICGIAARQPAPTLRLMLQKMRQGHSGLISPVKLG
jgi:hypothetical protein